MKSNTYGKWLNYAILGLLFPFILHAESKQPIRFISFEDFMADAQLPATSQGKPRWFKIEIGYAYNSNEPPGKTFAVTDLPEIFLEQGTLTTLQVLLGEKSQLADYTHISTDPDGNKLKEPFAMGSATYAGIRGPKDEGVKVSAYLYDFEQVNWNEGRFEKPYSISGVCWENHLDLPLDTWYVEVIDERAEETILKSESVVQRDFLYTFIRVTEI